MISKFKKILILLTLVAFGSSNIHCNFNFDEDEIVDVDLLIANDKKQFKKPINSSKPKYESVVLDDSENTDNLELSTKSSKNKKDVSKKKQISENETKSYGIKNKLIALGAIVLGLGGSRVAQYRINDLRKKSIPVVGKKWLSNRFSPKELDSCLSKYIFHKSKYGESDECPVCLEPAVGKSIIIGSKCSGCVKEDVYHKICQGCFDRLPKKECPKCRVEYSQALIKFLPKISLDIESDIQTYQNQKKEFELKLTSFDRFLLDKVDPIFQSIKENRAQITAGVVVLAIGYGFVKLIKSIKASIAKNKAKHKAERKRQEKEMLSDLAAQGFEIDENFGLDNSVEKSKSDGLNKNKSKKLKKFSYEPTDEEIEKLLAEMNKF